jgi:membrane protein
MNKNNYYMSVFDILKKIQKGIYTTVHILWDAAFAFFNEEALIRASSLAFTTLLSIIPLLTVVLSIMNFYGISYESIAEIETVFAQYLLPSQSRNIVAFIANAASDVTNNVGVVGLLGFCFTLVLMARELEGHVLKICQKKPVWWTSYLHYAAFVVLAPTAVILAFMVLNPLSSILKLLPEGWSHINYPFILAEFVMIVILRAFSDYSLSWKACTIGSIAGGIAAGASWKGCTLYFSLSASVTAYGTVAFIYSFLIWVFVAWCCMLFGVQVAAKTQCVLNSHSCDF